MFDHFAWSVLIVPALTVVVAMVAADHMPPRRAAAVLAWSAAGAAAAGVANLFLFAVKAVAEIPVLGRLFGWSSSVVAQDTSSVPWVSWLSLVLLLAAATAFFRTRRRHRAALALVGGFADLPSDREILIVPDPAPEAFSVEGPPGRIVVTTGMLDLLDDRQYAALLAHEREHLRGGHHRLARMAELACAVHPLLRVLATRVDYLLERAADEQAAASVGDRRSVALAVGAAALAGSGRGAGLHLAEQPGVVPKRVRELLRPRRRRLAWFFLILPAGLAGFSVVWTFEAARDLLELLQAAT
ncbi:M56 family metallopeptidase [Actinoplanes sp. LDG1-06]|uniref:M56 family metallopeptidase n=1 Tax=Paractinoplanes ovalisporus TaxID=2810368 RepID=A0ABS2AHR7_9ACTN|nr:M56 family metallopeptidase [Actinoplanes ovalisporus]MBM2619394.1 M56 family metallopeptidase [Actinoplanes ovalisporus]